MDGSAGYSGAYAADFSRLLRQINIASGYVDFVASYEAGGFMDPPGSAAKLGGIAAARLYDDYRLYYSAWKKENADK